MGSTERFETFSWQDATDALAAEWSAVVDSCRFNPTLGPGWSETIVASVAADRDIQVFASQRDDGLGGIVPYFIRSRTMFGIPVKVLEPLANTVSYHSELVGRHDAASLLEELLASNRNWQVFHASEVDVEGPTAEAIEKVAAKNGWILAKLPGTVSPYLKISGTWDEFMAGHKKKFRYKARKRKEQLQQDPALEMRWMNNESETQELLRYMLHIEKKSWKADANVAISDRQKELHYHELLLPFLARNDALMSNVLFHEGQPVAYNLCCYWNGWVGQLKTSFVKEFSEMSPGGMVIDVALEEAFRRGAKEFDFLGNADQHKLLWTKQVRQHCNYYLYRPRSLGHLVGLIQTVRDRLRHRKDPPETVLPSQ